MKTTLTLIVPLLIGSAADGQIRDQIIVYATTLGPLNDHVRVCRYSRKLELLGYTPTWPEVQDLVTDQTPLSVDGQGTYWITANPLCDTKLMRVDRDGNLLTSAVLGHYPVNITVTPNGTVVTNTRVPLLTPGPLYAVDAAANIVWSNIAAPQTYYTYPNQITTDALGRVWVAGGAMPPGGGQNGPRLTQISLIDGSPLGFFQYAGCQEVGGTTPLLGTSSDGTIWFTRHCASGVLAVNTDGVSVLKAITIDGGYNGATTQMHVDPERNPWVVSFYTADGAWGGQLRKYSATTGSLVQVHTFDGAILQWAFGATGDEAFVMYGLQTPPFDSRLARINLRTGVASTVLMKPEPYFNAWLATGDPTGYLYANIIDRLGDNDGDGASNGDEVEHGSHPFDPDSRPDGPKVDLSFLAGSNAIRLRYEDPSGLLDPVGGIDIASLSLVADGVGEILPALFSFLSSATIDPGGTTATLEFGLLPIPDDLKVGLEATVRDRTQAVGWDWQVTPPGHR